MVAPVQHSGALFVRSAVNICSVFSELLSYSMD